MAENNNDKEQENKAAEMKKKKCCKKKSIRKTIKILFALTIMNTLIIAACLIFLCTYKPKVLLLGAAGQEQLQKKQKMNSSKDSYEHKVKTRTAKTQIRMLEDALVAYKLDMGEYPSTEDGLDALMKAPAKGEKWKGPYLKSPVPKDPWGNYYIYVNPGIQGDFELKSYGADGESGGFGTDADITNYTID